MAYSRAGLLDEAHAQVQYASKRYEEHGDDVGQALVQQNLGWLLENRGRYCAALACARRALRLSRRAANIGGQADALNNIGWYHAQLGEHDKALASCRRALALHRQLDDLHGQADVWDNLGYAHHHLGQHTTVQQ